MPKSLTVLFLFIFSAIFVTAQTNVEFTVENQKKDKNLKQVYRAYVKKGDQLYFQHEKGYFSALEYYLPAFEKHPNSALLNYKIADCYLHTLYKNKALSFVLSAVNLNPAVSYDIDFVLGMAYKEQADCESAIKYFEAFKKSYSGNNKDSLVYTQQMIQQCGGKIEVVEQDPNSTNKVIGEIDKETYDRLKKEIIDSLKKELGIVEEPVYDKVPFDQDFSWMNGNNRQKNSLIKGKNWNLHMIFDMYVNFTNNNPIDHTMNNSSTVGRTGEFTINTATIGIEYTYKKVFARFSLQTGSMLSVIQETDGTVTHGRNLRTDDLKFIREAVIGYKINKLHGVTLEAGIFMSFFATESYNTQENWCYQKAFLVEFTPFYLVGVRSQIHLTKNFKIEPWVMNGWYSYGMFNHRPSYGMCMTYRPKEWLATVANFYVGSDTKLIPDRIRFHTDLSIQIRYVNRPDAKGLSKAAFHINGQYGFEDGGFDTSGITLPSFSQTYFAGISVNHRFWFLKNKIGWTQRAGFVKNPGRYIAFVPSPYGYIDNPTNDPAKDFLAWELTTTLDFMINDYLTIRLEYLYREANLPYFAGHGGTTAPNGWQPGLPGWTPDLVNSQHQWLLNFNVRF